MTRDWFRSWPAGFKVQSQLAMSPELGMVIFTEAW